MSTTNKTLVKITKEVKNTKYDVSIEANGNYTKPIYDFLMLLEESSSSSPSIFEKSLTSSESSKDNTLSSPSKEEDPSKDHQSPLKSDELMYGKVTVFNIGAQYEVFNYANVSSFNDFVSEIPYGVSLVVCKNKNIESWEGISKLPKSVTDLNVSGCLFKSLVGELCDTNIQELDVTSCKITSLEGINKTKINIIHLNDNPYYGEFIKEFKIIFPSMKEYLAYIKKKYDDLELTSVSESSDNADSECVLCKDIFMAVKIDCLGCINKFKTHVNDVDECGFGPLYYACLFNYKDCTDSLIKRGADLNKAFKKGDTPLHIACFLRNWDCVDILLKYRPDVNSKNFYGCTPLHYLCLHGEEKYVKLFIISHGANIYIRNNNGETPYELIRSGVFRTYVKILYFDYGCKK